MSSVTRSWCDSGTPMRSSPKTLEAESSNVSFTDAKGLSRPLLSGLHGESLGFCGGSPGVLRSETVSVPGHGQLPPVAGARPFELTYENMSNYRVEAAKDPDALPEMLKLGPDTVAIY